MENEHIIVHQQEEAALGDKPRFVSYESGKADAVHESSEGTIANFATIPSTTVQVDSKNAVETSLHQDNTRQKSFVMFVSFWLLLSFLTILVQFAYYANIFGIFAGQFHAISTQTEQWKTFIGVGIGAVCGAMFYRIGVRRAPNVFNERFVVILAIWTGFVSIMLIIPYQGATYVPPEALYYASTGTFGYSLALFSSSSETVFSKKLTQYIDVAGSGNVGKYLGIFYMAGAGARFAGPFISGAVTFIATPSGDVNYCPEQWVAAQSGTYHCPSLNNACFVDADQYAVQGCVLYRAIPFYAALAGVQFAVNICYHVMLYHHWSYE